MSLVTLIEKRTPGCYGKSMEQVGLKVERSCTPVSRSSLETDQKCALKPPGLSKQSLMTWKNWDLWILSKDRDWDFPIPRVLVHVTHVLTDFMVMYTLIHSPMPTHVMHTCTHISHLAIIIEDGVARGRHPTTPGEPELINPSSLLCPLS